MSPFNIVSIENESKSPPASKGSARLEAQARFDREWLNNPDQFNPQKNAAEKLRMQRLQTIILELFPDLNQIKVADMGCGTGWLSKWLAEKGAQVDAIDISTIPLKELTNIPRIHTSQDWLPRTKMTDDTYDLVIAAEILPYIPQENLRLSINELSRLVKPKGWVICSTAIDFHSTDALERFVELFETEFIIEHSLVSRFTLAIKINDFFQAPQRFVKASKNPEYRRKELKRRFSFSKIWFQWNSHSWLAPLWKTIGWILGPLSRKYEQSEATWTKLESLARVLSTDEGISHVILAGQRRPIISTPLELQPQERKQKKTVWE